MILAATGQLTSDFVGVSWINNNPLSGAGIVTLDVNFVIDTAIINASALTTRSWVIENAALATPQGA